MSLRPQLHYVPYSSPTALPTLITLLYFLHSMAFCQKCILLFVLYLWCLSSMFPPGEQVP